MVQITFLSNGGKTVEAPENSNLLRVSLREQGGIPFKCGGGLCGRCGDGKRHQGGAQQQALHAMFPPRIIRGV